MWQLRCRDRLIVRREGSSGFCPGLGRSRTRSVCQCGPPHAVAARWFPGVSVAKVKSHVSDTKARAMQTQELWDVLGNRAADQACKAARARDMPVVEEMTSSVAAQSEAQLLSLRQVYRYVLDLNAAQHVLNPRQNRSGSQPQPTGMDGPAFHERAPAVELWIESRRRTWAGPPHPPPAIMIFRDSPWGMAFTRMVWHWSQQLVWYKQQPGPTSGTTAVELLCHFVFTTGQLPPLRSQDGPGRTTLVPWYSPAAPMLSGNLRYWVHALTRVTQFLERATGWTLLAGQAQQGWLQGQSAL